MAEETYTIRYVAKDQAGATIDALIESIKRLDTTATQSQAGLKNFGNVSESVKAIKTNADSADASVKKLDTTLERMTGLATNLNKVADAVLRISTTGRNADENLMKAAGAAQALGNKASSIDGLKSAVEGAQRKAYGLSKNLEEGSVNLDKLTKGGAQLGGLGSQLKASAASAAQLKKSIGGVGSSLTKSTNSSNKFGASIGGLVARIAVVNQLKEAFEAVGTAIKGARGTASEGGKNNLEMREQFRELANLQGKPEPDNRVVGGALRFRVATGLDNDQANDALRRFEGGLPAAIANGNITGSSTEGLAGAFFSEATRTGLRTGMKGGTSGLLAAKLAQGEKIDSVDTGLNKFGAIVDTLNRGDGDLDPLIQGLIKRSGGYVGQNLAFPNLGSFAAAQSVASLNASPSVAGTRVQQAARALNRFGDRADPVGPAPDAPIPRKNAKGVLQPVTEAQQLAYEKKLAKHQEKLASWKPKAGDTLETLGIQAGQSFPDKIDALANALQGSKNPEADLTAMGFEHSQERASLLQFMGNRNLLRKETNAVNEGVDPKRIRADNARFMASDSTQLGIANAENDASKFAAFESQESVEVARVKAEASLRRQGKIDNAGASVEEAMMDNPIARFGATAMSLMTGQGAPTSKLPLFLGGKSAHQLKIDTEAERLGNKQARSMGVDPKRLIGARFGTTDTAFEDRFPVLSEAARNRGESPYSGTGQSEMGIRELIRAGERTNDLLESIRNGQAKPDFLPVNRAPGGFADGE